MTATDGWLERLISQARGDGVDVERARVAAARGYVDRAWAAMLVLLADAAPGEHFDSMAREAFEVARAFDAVALRELQKVMEGGE